MEVVTPGQIADIVIAGGKGSNLLKLHKASFRVPHFIIIPPHVMCSVDKLELAQRSLALAGLVNKIVNELPAEPYAVRSSACAEDGTSFSFAGQFKTLLNVSRETLGNAVMEVYGSVSDARANAYKDFSGVSQLQSAVIVQQMIEATAAGVAFSMNPVNGNKDEITINAVHGLGEKLVSGEVNADSYVFNRQTQKILAAKTTTLQVLNEAQQMQVVGLVKKVESFYGQPQDIEFAFTGNDLFLLQSRPVTTTKRTARIIWDNSNIVESYPGLTLPLTCSFIDKMYAAVYRQFCAVLGVSHQTIALNHALFDNLLGYINGRVYYNLNSWFGILSLLPGYQLNAGFMEKMMGVRNKPEFDIPPGKRKNSFRDYLGVANAIRCLAINLFTANKQRERFIKDFETVYDRFSMIEHEKLSAAEIWENYCAFERLMVERWKAPLVNDFFTMIYFGVLQKFCTNYLPGENNSCNELIAASKDVITTEPARLLPKLAELVNANETLKNIFLSDEPALVWETLSSSPRYEKEYTALKKYIDVWGERCIAELKLETITYKQQPAQLIAVLQSYLRNNVFTTYSSNEATATRSRTEEKMLKALNSSFLKKKIFKHVLSKARYFISNRENLRYYRTRGFGMVRQMLLALGKKFEEQKLIANARDIFYLRLEDIEQSVKQPGSVQAGKIVSEAKHQYQLLKDIPGQERIITPGNTGKYLIYPSAKVDPAVKGVKTILGTPCSPGIVRARVRLLSHATQPDVLNGEIMATYATDPGWVVLFPSAAGILTERGSLLSHAAIVSREMGIPCIVGLENLMQLLTDGDTVIMDGSTGVINILTTADEHQG